MNERIYVAMTGNLPICTHGLCGNDYKNGNWVELYMWNTWRRISKEPTIEITVKVNGKESKLSNISEETLLKIRKEN